MGDCFKVALEAAAIADLVGLDGVHVVHGLPLGRGPENAGLRYWHAWMEHQLAGEWWVVDASNGLSGAPIPLDEYYRLGAIGRTWRWSYTEAVAEAVHRAHFGPWVDHWQTYESKELQHDQ